MNPKAAGKHVHAYINNLCRCGKTPYQVEGELREQLGKCMEQLDTLRTQDGTERNNGS